MKLQLFALSLCTLLLGQTHAQNFIFHGSTVLIKPSETASNHPQDTTYDAINFYCYVGPGGYWSFGWYLGGDPHKVDSSHCVPNATRYDWYEYAHPEEGFECTDDWRSCRTHSIGFYAGWDGEPDRPMVDDEYKILGFPAGKHPMESLWVSYYDKVGGMHMVGVRRETTKEECEAAYKTLLRNFEEKKPPLHFELTYPCGGSSAQDGAGSKMNKVLGYGQQILNIPGSGWKTRICDSFGYLC